MLGFLIQYRHWIIPLVALAVFIGGLWFWGDQRYADGKADCEAAQIEKAATIAEKRNEIANNRPDTARFLDGLLRDADW